MRKLYLGIVLLCLAVTHLTAVNVTVKMNGVSQTMTMKNKSTGAAVAVGEPVSYAYTFPVEKAGTYVLSAFDAANNLNGTIELDVAGSADLTFTVGTVTTYLTNKDWVFNTDYKVECSSGAKDGTVRRIEVGKTTYTSETETGTRPSFLLLNGDTYIVRFTPYGEKVDEGYLFTYASATVTSGSVIATRELTKGADFTLIVPEGATPFVGVKRTHYVPFEEMPLKGVKTEGGKSAYTYTLANGSVYNFRVNQTGKLTHAGKFTMRTGTCDAIEVTAEDMNAQTPGYINHNPADNGMTNVGDIFLNINRKGLIRLGDPAIKEESFQVVNLRTWQLTDNSVGNYFLEPDFHYTVLDENFQPSDKVVTIDKKGLLKAVGKGRAIVQVTYDAINCTQYTQNDKFSPYMGGALWSAIWPENTGTFIVTVGEEEDPAMKPNLMVQTELPERLEEGNEVDSEHDIFYYMKDQPGYYYTFKPKGVKKVEVANPDVKTNPNKAFYASFSDANVSKTDTTFTALLTFGRNILRLTSETGKTTYQVVSAKPVGYTLTNTSRPDDTTFRPGDSIKVQFEGFYHPSNKLAGIYNMSAYLYFNGVPNGTSLILGPGQYTFAGNPKAQEIPIILPPSWDKETLDLKTGALQVKGYGSIPGAHRGINPMVGVNPNFTASVHVNFWGSIPDVVIPITQCTDGVKFEGVPDGVDLLVRNVRGDTLSPAKDGIYYAGPRKYTYEALGQNYKGTMGEFSITAGQGVQTIKLTIDPIDAGDNSWDGESISLPVRVTAEESAKTGGEFEGMEGYYKIKNGYELAWLSYYVNKAKENAVTNAVLTRNIDLKSHQWTPVGKSGAISYDGTFEGKNDTISNLFIDSKDKYQALFGYVSNARISDLTVTGSVTSTGNYVAGLIGDLEGYSIVRNCHNLANVTGNNYVGGIIGRNYHYPSAGAPVATLENCSNGGAITGNKYVGGVGGQFYIYINQIKVNGLFTALSNSGNVTCTTDYVGGIAGALTNVDITDVYNTGKVTSEAETGVGGVAGSNSSAEVVITNAYNTGVIETGYPIFGGAGKLVNTYTAAGEYKAGDDSTQVKTAAEFASGEVAWLLGERFGQKIGTESYPVLNGQAVLRAIYANNLSTEKDTMYVNGTLPVMEKEGYKAEWYDVPYGKVITAITENSTVYLLYTALDTEAPAQPEGLAGTATETTIALTWNASTDNFGVKGYNVYLDGKMETTVHATTHMLTRLAAGTSYKVEVEAFDEAGNKSPKAALTIATLDETAPGVPNGLAGVAKKTSIDLSWYASNDNVGVEGYHVYLNGTLSKSVKETAATIEGLTTDTEYTLEVEAYDKAGNQSEKASVVVKTLGETAISDVESESTRVYPNPFTDYIMVTVQAESQVVFYDLSGRAVLVDKIPAGETKINTSELPKGTYTVKYGLHAVKVVK